MPEITVNDLSPELRRLAAKAREAAKREEFEVVKSLCGQVLAGRPDCLAVRKLWFESARQAGVGDSGWWRGVQRGWGRLRKSPAMSGERMDGVIAADAMLQRDFGDPAAWAALIEAARRLDWGETELLGCETRAKLDPDKVEANLVWIEALLRRGRPQEALGVAQSLSQRHPQHAKVVAMLRRASVAVTVQAGKLNSSADG